MELGSRDWWLELQTWNWHPPPPHHHHHHYQHYFLNVSSPDVTLSGCLCSNCALCTGLQSMLESNTNFVLFVLVLSLLLVLSIFPIYSTFTHPLGNSDLLQTSVYCASHLSKSYGVRSFSYTGPTVWNTLTKDIRFSQSVSSFRSALKTHLFPT